jgi:rhodanese-related sulfurtransferase
MNSPATIRAEALQSVDPNRGVILDVRTAMEHAEKHIGFGHAHVPLDELKPVDFMMRHGLDRDAEVYILCRSGKRAAAAAEKFAAAGYSNVKVVEGGLAACEECGQAIKGHATTAQAAVQPSAKIKAPISLERQVRIAAGLFAAAGAALGLVVHPWFAAIPLFVGGGLIFAGVTDRCGMALILTRAPWNRMDGAAPASCPASNAKNAAKTGQSCQ